VAAIVATPELRAGLTDAHVRLPVKAILRSDELASFESILTHPWFDHSYEVRAKALVREMRQLPCTADVKEMVGFQPYCGCSFNLADFDRLIELPGRLRATLSQGIESFRLRLLDNGEHLVEVIDNISASDRAGAAALIRTLADFTSSGKLPQFNSHEVQLLCQAARRLGDVEFSQSYTNPADEVYDSANRLPPSALDAELFVNLER